MRGNDGGNRLPATILAKPGPVWNLLTADAAKHSPPPASVLSEGGVYSPGIVQPGLVPSNIRFWDIPAWDCKSCLVFEAASENQGLHSGIPTVLEAVEAGQAECGTDAGRSRSI